MHNFATHPAVIEITHRERVMGCWLGKAVGGTLGMPFEGHDGPHDLNFYAPVPTEMLPNDDLDLQVVWACTLNRMEDVRVDRHVLAEAWQRHIGFSCDEYGVALRNLAAGLKPPLTGSHDNWFAHGMGAAIRTEIWACLAPGNPELAAAYAYEDACVDHAGEGIHAAVFFAALESLAFVESDPEVLLDAALATLPAESLICRAVRDTRVWWRDLGDWQVVRELILRDYGHENFTDATMNVAFTILGWLASEDDFSRAICIAVNCGKDSDCTGATAGALMGILNPRCIPARWLEPIGQDLVLSSVIVDLEAPSTLDTFTDLVLALRERLDGRWPLATEVIQSTEPLAIPAHMGFAAELPLQAEMRPVWLPGTFATYAAGRFEAEYLLVRYRFQLEQDREVLVLFNTPQNCRVWMNGERLFAREGGRMAPSFHRAPPDQMARMSLAAGTHEILATLQRPADGRDAEWVVGLGDPASTQWLSRDAARWV